MDRRIVLGALLWLSAFKAIAASTWNAGSASPIIRIGQASDCSITWYSPGVFVYANGDFGFVAQGNNPAAGTASDSLFTARRSASSGFWTVPLKTDSPTLTGLYMIGGFPQNCGYSQSNPGFLSAAKPIYLPESISGVPGGRYYMAFGGGNADIIRGQVYWAYSDDAVHWVVWKFAPLPAGFQWRPLIGPLDGDPGFSPDPTCYPYGIGQVMLNYDPDTSLGPQGGFYLHLTYYHLPSEPRTLDMIAYRFQYDTSANGFGLGGNPQIYTCDPLTNQCSWVSHSGHLVWTYDGASPAPGDPLLSPHQGTGITFGAGQIVQLPNRLWLRIGTVNNTIYTQTASSLAAQDWSTPTEIGRTTFDSSLASAYPNYRPSTLDPGLWYGTIDARTGVFGFFPVTYNATVCPQSPYASLAVVSAPLDAVEAAMSFYTVPPCRLLDTRQTGIPLQSGRRTRSVPVTSTSCGIPSTAKAVSINVTVVSPTAPTEVGLTAGDAPPVLSTVVATNPSSSARAGSAVISLAADGTGTLQANVRFPGATVPAQADLLVDVNGYFQ